MSVAKSRKNKECGTQKWQKKNLLTFNENCAKDISRDLRVMRTAPSEKREFSFTVHFLITEIFLFDTLDVGCQPWVVEGNNNGNMLFLLLTKRWMIRKAEWKVILFCCLFYHSQFYFSLAPSNCSCTLQKDQEPTDWCRLEKHFSCVEFSFSFVLAVSVRNLRRRKCVKSHGITE